FALYWPTESVCPGGRTRDDRPRTGRSLRAAAVTKEPSVYRGHGDHADVGDRRQHGDLLGRERSIAESFTVQECQPHRLHVRGDTELCQRLDFLPQLSRLAARQSFL